GGAALVGEVQRLRPAEIIYPAESTTVRELLIGATQATPAPFGWIVHEYDDWVFAAETALFTVREHFKVASLDGFGLKDRGAATGAAGAVLHYLKQHLRREAANLTRISFYQRTDFLTLDLTS